METAEPRPAPSAATDDLRPEAAGPASGVDDRDPEQVVREAREAAGRPDKTDAYREAVAASEAEVGGAATRDRITSGELAGADGGPLLDGLSRSERGGLADAYVADLQNRAAGPDVALDATGKELARQTEAVHSHLGTVYQDPDAALARLEGLDAQGRMDFAAGRADLGERRPDAPGPDTNALLAHVDVRDNFPEASQAVDGAREQDRTRALASEVEPQGVDPTDAQRQEANPARKSIGDELSLANRMEHQLAYQAAGPQQI